MDGGEQALHWIASARGGKIAHSQKSIVVTAKSIGVVIHILARQLLAQGLESGLLCRSQFSSRLHGSDCGNKIWGNLDSSDD